MNQLFAVAFFLFSAGMLSAQKAGKIEWITPIKDGFAFSGKPAPDAYAFKENGKLIFASPGGDKRELPYDSIAYLGGDRWMIWQNKLKGIFSTGKGEVLPPVYESVTHGSMDCWAFTVGKYGMVAVVNDKNQILLPWRNWEYIGLNCLNDTTLEYIDKKGFNFTNMGYVSRNGATIPNEAGEKLVSGTFKRLAADKYVFTYIQNNKTRRDTFSAAGEFSGDIAVVQKGAQSGYLKRDGSWLIRPRFQAATPFDAMGHAAAKEKDRFGILRKDGTWAVPPRFEELKALTSVLYQFKEGPKAGLVDTTGRVLLPAGTYAALITSGTGTFGVKVADTIQVYNYKGELLPLPGISTYEGNGEHFIAKRKVTDKNGRKSEVTGVGIAPTGTWLVPPILRGRVTFGVHFIALEPGMSGPFEVAGIKVPGDQANQYLIFNRAGQLLIPGLVAGIPNRIGPEPYLTYKSGEKTGLVSKDGELLPAEYDEIRAESSGWLSVRKGNQWGLVRWIE